ncbi:hypothetical protein NL676_020334 [Syzygium grande]|nr:hypothetical protein NL676_020334 [Syzygium grande]
MLLMQWVFVGICKALGNKNGEKVLGIELEEEKGKSKRKVGEPKEENVTLGPAVREGEFVFGVAHIFASFNDTFIHVTDLSGRETLLRITGMSRASFILP